MKLNAYHKTFLIFQNLFSYIALFSHHQTIKNYSSNTATFNIKEKGDNVYSLQPGKTHTYNLYDYPKITILTKYHQDFSYSDGDVIISDMQKYTVQIENQTLKDITITEDDDLLEHYGDSISLTASESTTIYPYGLSFSAVDSDGVKREYTLTKNSKNYLLVIR